MADIEVSGECSSHISVKSKVVNSERTLETTRNQRNLRKLTSEENMWELKFNLDEMQELFTVPTRSYVKGLLLSLVDELQNRMENMRCDLTEKLGAGKNGPMQWLVGVRAEKKNPTKI